MRARCYDTKDPNFPRYGGRGVKVCDRWHVFEHFIEDILQDIGPRPSAQHSLDRYPNFSGDYEPGNVRWATRLEQSNNRRDNIRLNYTGHIYTLAELARQSPLKYTTIRRRLKVGWSIEDALTIPVGQRRPR